MLHFQTRYSNEPNSLSGILASGKLKPNQSLQVKSETTREPYCSKPDRGEHLVQKRLTMKIAIIGAGNVGSTTLTSTDGTNWTLLSSISPENLRAVTFADGRFVAVGDTGTIIQSDSIASRLALVRRPARLELTIHPGLGDGFTLQRSSDLLPWTDVATFTSPTVSPTSIQPTSADHARF